MPRFLKSAALLALAAVLPLVARGTGESGAAHSLDLVPLPRSVSGSGVYQVPQHVTIAASSADERNVAEFADVF